MSPVQTSGALASDVHDQLEQLGLRAAALAVDGLAEQASREQWSLTAFLGALLTEEQRARRSRTIATRLQLAHLPYRKTIETYDFAAQPTVDERRIRELASLRFLAHGDNLLLLGPPGVGKTHLAVGLAIAAIQAGHSAYFITAADLLGRLGKALVERRLEKHWPVYTKPEVLIIDELGYGAFDRTEATLLFQLVSRRYEKGSIILTSNRSYAEWGELLGDTVLATALLDRLLHHSETITIRGESYRLREKRQAGVFTTTAAHQNT